MQHIQAKLSLFYLLYYAMIGCFMPFWNVYLEHQGLSYQEIGILASIGVMTRLFAPLIWGWIADRSGKRMYLIRLATAAEALVWLGLFIFPNRFQTMAMFMLIFNFFQNAILAQFEAVTSFWLAEQRQRLYGKIRQWGSVGFIIAVFGLGALLDLISIQWLPMVLFGLAIFTFVASLSIAEPSTPAKTEYDQHSIFKILRRPEIAAFFAIEFILLFSHAPFYSFYSNFLAHWDYSHRVIGALWALGVVAEIVMFTYANYFFKRFTWRWLVAICLMLTALRWCLVGLYPHLLAVQIFAQCIHAFSFGLFHVMAMRMIFENFSVQQQGRGQAIYSTMWGLGVAVGSVLSGHYWKIYSGETIFILAGASCLVGLLLLVYLPKRHYL